MFRKKAKDDVQLKFEFIVTIKSLEKLPAKYKHLRLSLSKGAKQAGTRDIFAENQSSQPNAVDGTMKMICSMYRAAPGTPGMSATGFEERTYKLALMRINTRAIREKEKKIGSCWINLADYASTESANIGEDITVTMKVAEASEPTIVQLKIRSKWLQNYKASDSDGASNYSAVTLETASVGTGASGRASLNSIDEDEEEEEVEVETPKVNKAKGSSLSPEKRSGGGKKGGKGTGGDEVDQLQARVDSLEADLEWSQSTVEDLQNALDHKEQQVKKLEEKLESAMRVQQELIDENVKAQEMYESLHDQIENNKKSKNQASDPRVAPLQAEVEKYKEEVKKIKEEREGLRKMVEDKETERAEAADALAAENAKGKGREGRGGRGKDDDDNELSERVDELEKALAREKGKSQKYKSFVEKMNETKGALETEIALLKAGGAQAVAASTGGGGGGDGGVVDAKHLEGELERVSMQLVAASLGHAQAEQDRLEAKQQLYRIRDDNRRLKEKLTALEFQLASHTSDSC